MDLKTLLSISTDVMQGKAQSPSNQIALVESMVTSVATMLQIYHGHQNLENSDILEALEVFNTIKCIDSTTKKDLFDHLDKSIWNKSFKIDSKQVKFTQVTTVDPNPKINSAQVFTELGFASDKAKLEAEFETMRNNLSPLDAKVIKMSIAINKPGYNAAKAAGRFTSATETPVNVTKYVATIKDKEV